MTVEAIQVRTVDSPSTIGRWFPETAQTERPETDDIVARRLCIAAVSDIDPPISQAWLALVGHSPVICVPQERGLYYRIEVGKDQGLYYRMDVGLGAMLTEDDDDADSSAQVLDDKNIVAYFVRSLSALDRSGNIRASGDLIFDRFDELLSENTDESFELCNQILAQIDVNAISSFSLRSILNITFAAKSKLMFRPEFFRHALDAIANAKGPEKAKVILSGLE